MKQLLSLLLTLTMLVTSFPLTALAEEQGTPAETQQEEVQPTETQQEPEAPAAVEAEAPQETEQPTATPEEEATEQPAEEPTAAPATEAEEPPAAPAPAAEDPAAALLTADVGTLSFDTLTVGYETAAALTFTLTNTGDAEASLRYSNTEAFSVSGAASLAAGASATVTVTPVAGLAAGTYSETLTLAADSSEVSVALRVEVADAALMMPSTLIEKAVPTPDTLVASAAGYNSVLLSWDSIDGADGYILYRSTMQSSNYIEVGRVKTVVGETAYTFTARSLTCGTLYYFKMRAYSGTEISGWSTAVRFRPLPLAPTGLAAEVKSMRSIRLTWTANATGSASGYYIYMSNDNVTFTRAATITSRATVLFDHTNLTPGTTYYYKIASYYTVNGINQESMISEDTVNATPALPAVTTFAATSLSTTSVRLKWTKVSDVTGYRIIRRKEYGGKPSATFDIPLNTILTMDDTSLLVGTTYYYTIEPYYYVNSVAVYGPETETTGMPVPLAPTTIAAASYDFDKIKITWSEATDADGYYIYRRNADEADSTFTKIDFTTGTEYIDGNTEGLVTGKAYQYYVTSYTVNAGGPVESTAPTKTALARPKPDQVVNVTLAREAYDTMIVSWDESDGAKEYILEVSTVSTFTSAYTTKISVDASTTTATVTGLTCGRPYYYRVTSTVTVGTETTSGAASVPVAWRTVPATPEWLPATYTSSSNVLLKWAAASDGASGYYIKRSLTEDTGYNIVGTVTSPLRLYYIDSGLTTAQTYYYKICPFVTYNNSKYAGTDSDYIAVKALPGKPVISSVISLGTTSLRVTWTAVLGATGYTLRYSNNELGPYTDIDIPSATQTMYNMIDLVKAQETTYVKIQAYTVTSNGVTEVGEESAVVTGVSQPGQVFGLTVTPADGNTLTLNWTALQTKGNVAAGYYVYSCNKDGTGGTRIANVESGATPTYTVTGLENGGTGLTIGTYYYYYVTAYAVGTEDPWIEGTRSDIKGTLITPKAPANLTVTVNTYNSLLLTWDEVFGVAGYEVYFSVDNVTFRYLLRIVDDDAALDTMEFAHTKLIPGKTYYYRVRSYINPTATSYLYGPFCNAQSMLARPFAPTDVAATVNTTTGKPLLTWVKADGATGYIVYYDTDPDGAFSSYVAVTTNASYANMTSLTTGKTYYFKVKSRVLYNNATVTSEEYSNTESAIVAPAKPTGVKVTSVNYQAVRVSWAAVTGALGYYVYVRSDVDGDGYTLMYKVEGSTTKTIASNLISGRYMNYTVAAYCNDYSTGDELVGIESAIVRARVRLAAPTTVTAKALDYDRISVSWTGVTGAQGYRVTRKVTGEPGYTELVLLMSADARQYTDVLDSEIGIGTKMYYIVEAWLDSGDTEVVALGAPSVAVSVNRLPPTPTNLMATGLTYTSIQLDWDDMATPGSIDTYEIQYSKTSSTGGFTTLTGLSALYHTFKNIGLRTKTTYYYRIRSVKTVNRVTYFSPYSAVASATPMLDTIEELAAAAYGTGGVKLTWEYITGANGYYIVRKLSTESSYTRIASVTRGTTLYYVNKGLTVGKTYDYKVVAYRYVNGTAVTGLYSDAESITVE